MTDPHWTQWLAALLTPTIAIFGSIIAYLQWRTAHRKLKFELFEKRFSVYNAARTFITSVMTSGKAKDDEMHKFLYGTRETKWLLSDEIVTYFDAELWSKACELQMLEANLEGVHADDERSENIRRTSEIKKWIMAQYKVLDEAFSPFLKLEQDARKG